MSGPPNYEDTPLLERLRAFVRSGNLGAEGSDILEAVADLSLVKRLFIGDERPAVQVHPVASEHYSLRGKGRAERVLHLWAPLTGELPLPDFLAARGGTL